MIEVEGLRKEYDGLVAVDGVTFTAEPGAIFGLLGPNGAGKSTTIGCISGLLEPTAGHVCVRGHDVVREGLAARSALGVVPQEIALYEEVSAEENLLYWGEAYRMHGESLRGRVRDVLELSGLLDRSKEPVKRFSGGMKRRLNFACGIVHQPQVLLLDEPTVGVDPQSRVRLLELVREQARSGTCVLYTTHYMEEARALRSGAVAPGRQSLRPDLLPLRRGTQSLRGRIVCLDGRHGAPRHARPGMALASGTRPPGRAPAAAHAATAPRDADDDRAPEAAGNG